MNAAVEEIRSLLEAAFQPEQLEIEDESWKHAGHAGVREHGGGHYIVRITAAAFAGKNRPQCHRMVYEALGSMFPTKIHALSIQAAAPDSTNN